MAVTRVSWRAATNNPQPKFDLYAKETCKPHAKQSRKKRTHQEVAIFQKATVELNLRLLVIFVSQ